MDTAACGKWAAIYYFVVTFLSYLSQNKMNETIASLCKVWHKSNSPFLKNKTVEGASR